MDIAALAVWREVPIVEVDERWIEVSGGIERALKQLLAVSPVMFGRVPRGSCSTGCVDVLRVQKNSRALDARFIIVEPSEQANPVHPDGKVCRSADVVDDRDTVDQAGPACDHASAVLC